jgi:hypothetical protein
MRMTFELGLKNGDDLSGQKEEGVILDTTPLEV